MIRANLVRSDSGSISPFHDIIIMVASAVNGGSDRPTASTNHLVTEKKGKYLW